MNTIRAVIIVVVCAIVVAWIGNMLVSNTSLLLPRRGESAMSFAPDGEHHHEHGRDHHGVGGERGIGELAGSTLLFGAVSIAVVVPSIVWNRRKRTPK